MLLSAAGDFEVYVTITAGRDMLIRITFQDDYHILDQARLRMRYRDDTSTRSKNMTSEQAFVNGSTILIEVPHSRLPYQRFQVDVALQVGGESGPFVSDGIIHGEHACRIINTCSMTNLHNLSDT